MLFLASRATVYLVRYSMPYISSQLAIGDRSAACQCTPCMCTKLGRELKLLELIGCVVRPSKSDCSLAFFVKQLMNAGCITDSIEHTAPARSPIYNNPASDVSCRYIIFPYTFVLDNLGTSAILDRIRDNWQSHFRSHGAQSSLHTARVAWRLGEQHLIKVPMRINRH